VIEEAVIATQAGPVEPSVVELSVEDSRRLFGQLVRDRMGMSREQYLERLDRGDLDGVDTDDAVRLRILAPFGR